jgi:RNA polymerase sigma factor (sigma-70 family)
VVTQNLGNAAAARSASVSSVNVPQSANVESEVAKILRIRDQIQRQIQAKGLSSADAEELFQAALFKAIESIDRLNTLEKFENWFRVILRNVLMDYFRRQKRETVVEDIEILNPELISETESHFCTCTLKLLDLLKPELREVIHQRILESRDVKATSKSLGISESLVKVRTHRAKQALKLELQRCCGIKNFANGLDCKCS